MSDPITVEAEYSHNGGKIDHWTFQNKAPQEAKDVVVSRYVPLDATLFRVSLWKGTFDDRPPRGHEDGILDE